MNSPAQYISDGLLDLGFTSVKQISVTRLSPSEGPQPKTSPLFLINWPRTVKFQEIFRLTTLCHIAIRVEAYGTQNGLTECHNCQQFGHVWPNCKQPPRCLCSGAATYTKSVQRKRTLHPLQHAVTVSW
jgi:hypothetical protein